jgi:hypothetical protein
VCSDPSAPWLPTLLHRHSGCLITLLNYGGLPPALLGYPFGFMQGSRDLATFCARYDFQHLVYSLTRGSVGSPPPHLTSFTLAHVDFGGVMWGRWEFWSPETVKHPSPPPVEGRTLYHVIDNTCRVPSFNATAAIENYTPQPQICWVDTDETIVDSCGLLPAEATDHLVCCPLIYSPTKWAIRKLTAKELLA